MASRPTSAFWRTSSPIRSSSPAGLEAAKNAVPQTVIVAHASTAAAGESTTAIDPTSSGDHSIPRDGFALNHAVDIPALDPVSVSVPEAARADMVLVAVRWNSLKEALHRLPDWGGRIV